MATGYIVKRRPPLAVQNNWTFFVIGSTKLHLTMEEAAVTMRDRESFFRSTGDESFEVGFNPPKELLEPGDQLFTDEERKKFLAIYITTPQPFISAL